MSFTYKVTKTNKLKVKTSDGDILYPSGVFSVDNNFLIYEVTESVTWRRKHGISKKIVFKGSWSIDKNNNLKFSLNRAEGEGGVEKISFDTSLIETKSDYLIFSIKSCGKPGNYKWTMCRLKGKWQADKYNRIQFLVQKTKEPDVLTFKGVWTVKNNTFTYIYKRSDLATKTKKISELRFEGYWHINEANRLVYYFDIKSNPSFVFKVHLQTPNIIGKDGVIKYRVGIGLKGSNTFRAKTIVLYGVWKFSRKGGISFEIDYGRKRANIIDFNVFVKLCENDKITFSLLSKEGADLRLSLEFSKKFLKNKAEWFVKLFTEGSSSGVEWGINIPW
ncbi:MAG: hypothetical protein WC214_03405 [Candidatus Omnitrophota bacterium]